MSYMPYRLCDETLDQTLRKLTADSTDASTQDLRDVRKLCAYLCNNDIDRITALTKWNPPRADYDSWRANCRAWHDREARFVLAALRWEYYQHYTLALLWLESMEVVETDARHELENQMVVDDPSGCQMLISGRDGEVGARVLSLGLIREKVHTSRHQVDDDVVDIESD